jgi:protein-L-isoaspartate(D-aspartate) O-methyltransferase
MDDAYFSLSQQQMLTDIAIHVSYVQEHIGKEALDPRVMHIMGKVPRHEFVPSEMRLYAYADTPLPIGYDKTISQPFIVALMTDLLALRETDIILEIGTGLGYQAAILAELAAKIYTMEIIEELFEQAQRRLQHLDYNNVKTQLGNGYYGWPEVAPFDKIIVTAAPDLIPPPLIQQLKCGGKLVLPAGLPDSQQLIVVEKAMDGRISTREVLPVRFSPLENPEAAILC